MTTEPNCWKYYPEGSTPGSAEVIELRDFSAYIPEEPTADRIPWEQRAYCLINSIHGRMLYINHRMPITEDTPYDTIDFSDAGMPDIIEIPIPFSGAYAIWACVPVLDTVSGIDLALNDDCFQWVGPSYGGRRGRMIGLEYGKEYRIFWKKAYLHQSRIRIRVPYGTFNAADLYVRAALAALRFERLDDSASLAPVDGAPDKDFLLVVDGFSHYAMYGMPDECFDLRLDSVYEHSDVNIIMTQIMGPLLWKSDVNTYLGEGVSADDYAGKRICDVRVIKYVQNSVKRQHEVFRVQTEACHKRGMEMHFSIRANLYFPPKTAYMSGNDYMNGRFWTEHPEYRLPDSLHLDYGRQEVQEYHLSVYRDVLERFDIDGINLDLTRWPCCLDARYHSPKVLIGFCRKLRALADEFGEKRGKHIKVSLLMVEYYHSGTTLEAQAIDFEGLAASGTLDFISLQTNNLTPYSAIAKKYGLKLFGTIDTESPYFNRNSDDPVWALPDGHIVDDPAAGEEFRAKQAIASAPAPYENYRTINEYYQSGADGIAKVNAFIGTLFFRDCGHSDAVRRHADDKTVFGQIPGEEFFLM